MRSGGKSSAICDFDFLLQDKDKDVIEGIINSLVLESNGVYGGAIAIIKKIDPRYLTITKNTEGFIEEYTEAYANHIFENWRLKDSDFLIFLVVEDRQIYVTSGNEMQKQITMQHLQTVIRNVAPLLKDQNYSDALKNMILQFKMIIVPDNASNESFDNSNIDNFEDLNMDNILINDNTANSNNNNNNNNNINNNNIDTTIKEVGIENVNISPLPSSTPSPFKSTIASTTSSTASSSTSDTFIIIEDDKSITGFKKRYLIGAAVLGYGLYESYKFIKYKWDIYINTNVPANYYDDDWDFDETIFNSTFPFKCEYCAQDFGNFSYYKNFQISTRATKALADYKDPTKPLLMNCGHMFCVGCIALMLEGNDKNCPICYTKFDDNTFDNDNSNDKRRYIKFTDDIETISFNTVAKKMPSYIQQSLKNMPSSIQNPNTNTNINMNANKKILTPSSIISGQIRSNQAKDIMNTTSTTNTFRISGSMGSLRNTSNNNESTSTSTTTGTGNESKSAGTGGTW